MTDQPHRTLCCWPGLAGLWLRGQWSSLFVAIGFSLVLNLALVSTFVWPVLLGPQLKLLIWPAVLISWVIFGVISWRTLDEFQKVRETPSRTDDTLFNQAQTEYLKGDFTQAELLLVQQLRDKPRDAEARLLLATLFRRTDRFEKAQQQLEKLQRIDDSVPWQFEITREQQLIDQAIDFDESPVESDQSKSIHEEPLQDVDLANDTAKQSNRRTIKLGEAAVNSVTSTVESTVMSTDEAIHEDKPVSNSISISTSNQKRAA